MSTASTPKKRLLYDDNQPPPHNPPSEAKADLVFISSPIHDRQSTFTAHFHPASSAFPTTTITTGNAQKSTPAIPATIKRLQSHPSFRDASHRIAAWRKRSSQQTLFATAATAATAAPGAAAAAVYVLNSDDDGEKHAGKRLEKVLCEMDVEGVLVVARWYGGVLLGPVRFTHMETCAREAIRKWRDSLGAGEVPATKRPRLDDGLENLGGAIDDAAARGEAERVRLAKQLAERDASVSVLRELLAGKTVVRKPDASQQSVSAAASPAKTIDYNGMPLAKLKQLDRARDATIAFILKQLDKVEEEEKARDTKALKVEDGDG